MVIHVGLGLASEHKLWMEDRDLRYGNNFKSALIIAPFGLRHFN